MGPNFGERPKRGIKKSVFISVVDLSEFSIKIDSKLFLPFNQTTSAGVIILILFKFLSC